ncbi:MAG: HAMP domain-containing sensor histidine kinase [Dehalococcoidia bacterium]
MRDNVALRTPAGPPRGLATFALALAAAVIVGLLVAQLLIQPSAGDMRALALYIVLSGAATLLGGAAGVQAADRAGAITLRTKVALGGLIGALVGLLNVFIVSQLMFVSTSHDLRLLISLIAVSATISLGFSTWVARTITRRLREVTDGVRVLSLGRYETRLHPVGRDEVARLAEDVNVLAGRLQEAEDARAALERDRRDFTIAISHDLRTPLASMRAMAEALDDEVVTTEDEVRRYHRAMRRESERLGAMIDDLFQLSQLDAGSVQLNRRPLALDEIAAEVVDAMQAQAASRGIRLTLEAHGPVPLASLDGALIERAVRNLVSNALAYTPSEGSVAVLVEAAPGGVALHVRDTGQGIASEDVPRVWDRFFRAERSRTRTAEGSDGAGLGLAIVRGIAEAHSGSTAVESTPGVGSTFSLSLPVA